MESRQLRLGDVLDDYCPRERRITNHAVVALVSDAVKRTRCTTCAAEHEYKGGEVPSSRRKKKTAFSAPNRQVLAEMPQGTGGSVGAATKTLAPAAGQPDGDRARPAATPSARADRLGRVTGGAVPDEDGPVHRRLIRATLPRAEGQTPGRPVPEFTIRQSGHRASGFRGNNRTPSRAKAAQGGSLHQPDPLRPARQASAAGFRKSSGASTARENTLMSRPANRPQPQRQFRLKVARRSSRPGKKDAK